MRLCICNSLYRKNPRARAPSFYKFVAAALSCRPSFLGTKRRKNKHKVAGSVEHEERGPGGAAGPWSFVTDELRHLVPAVLQVLRHRVAEENEVVPEEEEENRCRWSGILFGCEILIGRRINVIPSFILFLIIDVGNSSWVLLNYRIHTVH